VNGAIRKVRYLNGNKGLDVICEYLDIQCDK
jgi:hypothetical protein